MTNYNFTQVFHMGVVEFFSYVAYLKYKAAKEEQRIKELQRKKR